nr:hypothetical transcript [Hymenolepis microstoma]
MSQLLSFLRANLCCNKIFDGGSREDIFVDRRAWHAILLFFDEIQFCNSECYKTLKRNCSDSSGHDFAPGKGLAPSLL